MTEARWTLCPRCGSFDLHGEYWSIMGQQHKCKECGYTGSFVIEAGSREEALELQREIEADREAQREQDEDDAQEED